MVAVVVVVVVVMVVVVHAAAPKAPRDGPLGLPGTDHAGSPPTWTPADRAVPPPGLRMRWAHLPGRADQALDTPGRVSHAAKMTFTMFSVCDNI